MFDSVLYTPETCPLSAIQESQNTPVSYHWTSSTGKESLTKQNSAIRISVGHMGQSIQEWTK